MSLLLLLFGRRAGSPLALLPDDIIEATVDVQMASTVSVTQIDRSLTAAGQIRVIDVPCSWTIGATHVSRSVTFDG